MNLPRVLNAVADVYGALRLAGWSAEEAARITTKAARDAVNRIPSKPYPQHPDALSSNSDSSFSALPQTEQYDASDSDFIPNESFEF